MIVNPETNRNMSKDQILNDNPPAYDVATTDFDKLNEPPKPQPPVMTAGPSYAPRPMTGSPPVYNYVNPRTGEHVVSLLPPHHPEMVCLQAGEHIPHTSYSLLGIFAAIFWFPLGIGLCLLDRRIKCERCGTIIEDGVCR